MVDLVVALVSYQNSHQCWVFILTAEIMGVVLPALKSCQCIIPRFPLASLLHVSQHEQAACMQLSSH